MTDPFLARGDEGHAVRDLQVALNAAGLARIPATGRYDATTEAAVKAAQRALGLAVNGVACPETLTALGIAPSAPVSLGEWGVLA